MYLSEPNFIKPPKEKLKRATRRRKCPICDGIGCGYNSEIVLCWRVEAGSKERAKSGAFIHVLNDDYTIPFMPMSKPVEDPKAPAETISKVYESLLDCLVLSDKHTRELQARGLSPNTITKNRYKTVPTKVEGQIVRQYLDTLYNLDYVPGFYMEDSQIRRLNVKGSGIFIPYRDPNGVIRGMQVRPDRGSAKYFWFSSTDLEKGASSGSFTHYAGVDKTKTEIYITEGGLKADCIAELSGAMVVAMAGVTAVNYDTLMHEIKDNLPAVNHVVLAFDIDWKTNIHVQMPLLKLTETAREYFTVEVQDWDPKLGKGFDDKLLKEKHG
jgi:hypothetical protein